ncbi:hypothetical protein C8R44DRAFT_749849 [Mycena epipterygia]|nr:hypothetical protein C8R44DRAFT_749849 [Mycena epipterygia]
MTSSSRRYPALIGVGKSVVNAGGSKASKSLHAVSGGFTNTISGLKYRWGGTRVRADIPPVFGGVTAAQTAGEGGSNTARALRMSPTACSPPAGTGVYGRGAKGGRGVGIKTGGARLDERETEDGEHVNRPPVLGGPGGAEAAGRGRAPKMLACSGLIAEKDAFVLQGDGKIAPSMDGHPDTEGRRRAEMTGEPGALKRRAHTILGVLPVLQPAGAAQMAELQECMKPLLRPAQTARAHTKEQEA